jgi:hypothetical protein
MPDHIEITFELEPIVKVLCLAIDCRNNLYKMDAPHCNLKHIRISADHVCSDYERRDSEAGNGQS